MKKLMLVMAISAVGGLVCGAQGLKKGELQNVTRLTNDAGMKYENPQWSPDGKKVSFTNLGYNGLYVMNSDGSAKKQLSDAPGVGYLHQWGADSKEILVRDTRWVETEEGTKRAHAAWALDMNGMKTRMSDDAEYMQPATWRYDASGVKAVAGVGAKKMAASKGSSLNLTVAKEYADKMQYKNNVVSDFEHLYLVNELGMEKVIYDGEALAPVLSPDGKKVAFVTMASEIMVMNIDGSNMKKVAEGFAPAWVNNDQLVYERTTDDGHIYLTGELYLTNMSNGMEKQLTNTGNRIEMNACVSPDGSKLLFTDFYDGQVYVADLK